MQATHLRVGETAKLIRGALKRAFPGVTFSVKSRSYSGGCSVDVRWTDGPTHDAVDAVASMFRGRGFDALLDLSCYTDVWLLPDGTATLASSEREWMPHPDAKRISTGAHVFCRREG